MSEAISASAPTNSTVVGTEDYFRPSSIMNLPIIGDSSTSSSSNAYVTQEFSFSSGNPKIEETRGVMRLFLDAAASYSSKLPVERSSLICVLGLPNHMTYAKFCQFCDSFIHHIMEMRIIRIDGMENRYSILVRFKDQSSTDSFQKHFNGRRFSSLETKSCRVLFTNVVKYSSTIEHTQNSPSTPSTDQPTCSVCLERLDQDMSGILITICNHSFHCSCISKQIDSSCPVCQYSQQSEKSKCLECQTSVNMWVCLLCGFVGCRRHAVQHWKNTKHCYLQELATQSVCDFVENNYVIELKTDGRRTDGDCGCDTDPVVSEAIFNSQVKSIVSKYNELLKTQLEIQKLYYGSLLQDIKESNESDILAAVQDSIKQNTKLQKIQTKLDRFQKEKMELDEMIETISRNKAEYERLIEASKDEDEIPLDLKTLF